ncbi:hypothetical protein PISMIDRAFT_685265 [Pisolithus microcarpus 441]|uniref:Uncharacterized protein n=1 Tax=Pisolithus microcarpus 441 TaxID=765257 RepID=A0A0C9XYH8_9AGAM|nr:hypothetical protein PISMIDRAFT_685265 [Pisolithus microcarpus 441]
MKEARPVGCVWPEILQLEQQFAQPTQGLGIDFAYQLLCSGQGNLRTRYSRHVWMGVPRVAEI